MTINDRERLTGYILIIVSAVTFSAKGVFAKLIYAHGVDPTTLLGIRFAMTMPLFWATLFFFPSGRVGARDACVLAVIGLVGFFAAAYADFYGLLFIDATLERIILYSYPAVVVLLAAVFLGERLTMKKAASVAITYIGLGLTLKVWNWVLCGGGGGADSVIGTGGAFILGAALVFSAAVMYSASYILMEVTGRRVSGVKMSAWATTIAGCAFMAVWRFRNIPEEPVVWAYLVLLSVVSTYLPILTLLLGIRRLGASHAAVVSFVGPVSTAVIAAFVLGERLEGVQMLGMAVVLAGVAVISTGKPGRGRA
jgi:drug/metabolite transporter (DMT)-like permease